MSRGASVRIAWVAVLAALWPVVAIGAFHLALGGSRAGTTMDGTLAAMGGVLLLAAPGMLAIGAAEESARWRRITGAAVAIVTLIAVIVYGSLVVDSMNCREVGPAQVAPTTLVVGVAAAAAAGLAAWQGGRLVAALRWLGVVLAFILGLALLAMVFGAVVLREVATGCFGY